MKLFISLEVTILFCWNVPLVNVWWSLDKIMGNSQEFVGHNSGTTDVGSEEHLLLIHLE